MFDLILLFFVGIGVSCINVVAGGGSLISLPVLIFLGVPPVIANASNRLGIVMQNVFAVYGFHQKGVSLFKFSTPLALSGLVGAVLGARIAINIPEQVFKTILAGVMILISLIMLLDPIRKSNIFNQRIEGRYWFLSTVIYFFIGIYAGFIQAGVGLLSIATNVLVNRLDLVRSNCVKVTVALVYATASVLVFAYFDLIWWSYGLSLGCGTAMGGWFMSRFSISKGHEWVKKCILFAIFLMAIRLFFISV